MKTRHDHKLGARLFLTVPNYSLDSGKWAFLFLSIYDPFTIIVEKSRKLLKHGKINVLEKRNWEYRFKNIITEIGKHACSEWCAGVYVWKGCGMSVAGSPGELLVWRFCFMWSFGQNFLFRTARSSRHQDLGLCKYTLYKEHHQFGF